MSQRVREELLPRLRQRYANRGREGKSRLIDELVEDFGYSRKHAIKLLNARAGWGGQVGVPRGRPPRYGAEVVQVLKTIWKAQNSLAANVCRLCWVSGFHFTKRSTGSYPGSSERTSWRLARPKSTDY